MSGYGFHMDPIRTAVKYSLIPLRTVVQLGELFVESGREIPPPPERTQAATKRRTPARKRTSPQATQTPKDLDDVALARKVEKLAYRRWVLGLWKHRATVARSQAQRPPHRSQWICIHRYEGSWADPGAPYYGGLQMDVEFQRTYGIEIYRAKGTADHWTALEQMWVAERAYRTRGFWPWPNTARYCGLL